jgi:VIT1/CCC1 family predicted Fe2+/Mn2+ transporter
MINARVIVYATIIQLAAFAIFDQGDTPITEASFRNIITVSLGPMIAVALAHTFAEVLDHQLARGNHFTWADVVDIIKPNAQFLYVGLAPIVITIPFLFTNFTNNDVINIIFVFGVTSLFIWGFIAARSSGRPLRGQIIFSLAYGILGMFVVGIELLLGH